MPQGTGMNWKRLLAFAEGVANNSTLQTCALNTGQNRRGRFIDERSEEEMEYLFSFLSQNYSLTSLALQVHISFVPPVAVIRTNLFYCSQIIYLRIKMKHGC